MRMIELTDRTALVTGGGIGIGRSIALALANAGADVALTYRSHDGEAVAEEIRATGRRSAAFELDVTSRADVDRVVDEAADSLGGRIDILVNNAGGLLGRIPIAEMPDEHWTRVIELDLTSVFRCTQATLRHMGEGGRIVSISSLAARNGGGPGSVAYAAAKAGIHGFTRGLAKELGPRGISVNAIAPGLVLDTPFHETFTPLADQRATIDSIPLHRGGLPADCAGAVLYLVSDLGSFANGAVIDLNGGAWFS
jgi:3-oxoacyl-[acyl-carrier protein] reductase